MELTDREREVVALLERALAAVRRDMPERARLVDHLEAALKCFHDPHEGIPPEQLNSANDG